MGSIERKSALTKAPAIDVVEALTAPTAVEADMSENSRSTTTDRDTQSSAPAAQVGGQQAAAKDEPDVTPVRRGPGRPRSRRRMEPLSTKIDIELRDQVDAYLSQHEMTFVDLLDEALRAKIAEQ